MVYIITFLVGSLIGSFLNVCIYRIPRVHLSLTEQSFAALRGETFQNDGQPTQHTGIWAFIARYNIYIHAVRRAICKHIVPICHFWGLATDLSEESLPSEILTKLEGLKAKEYITINDFADALEEQIGQEQAAQYGDHIFQQAVSRKESIVLPASHCPHCDTPIKPWENVPILSFLLLRGKCRSCRVKISWRYPIVELLTALLFLAFVHRFGITPLTLVYLAFVGALIVISFIDLEHRIIPNRIALPGIIIGIIASFFVPLPATVIRWYGAFLGATVGGGVILLVGYVGTKVFKREAMGGGDVKLMAMIGAFLGWEMALMTIFFGSLAGAVIGLIIKLIAGKDYIPFGPFLSVGALIAIFFGHQLLFWYWNLVVPPL